ncbi:MAG: type II toxin-antitoxin system PemK/MazF family toxin [Acidimicrobiales bacterium]
MVARGDIIWADLGEPAGRRPVCVLTRDAAIEVLTALTCAPITRTIRGIRSEVAVGTAEGLPEASVITCDNLVTIPIAVFDDQPVGHLDLEGRIRLDVALRFALDIQY